MARVVRARAQSAGAGRLRGARRGAWCASSFQRIRHRWDAAARFVARGRDCPRHCNGKHARAASSTFIRPPRRATTTSRANSLGGGRRCCELVASEPARQLAREHGHNDTRRMDVLARRHGQDGGLDEVGERRLEHLVQITNPRRLFSLVRLLCSTRGPPPRARAPCRCTSSRTPSRRVAVARERDEEVGGASRGAPPATRSFPLSCAAGSSRHPPDDAMRAGTRRRRDRGCRARGARRQE